MNYYEALTEVRTDLTMKELADEARRYLKRGQCGTRADFVRDAVTAYDDKGDMKPGQFAALQRIVAYRWAAESREEG